ncbi:hypothetical protein AX17_004444 [Amanita inopinata Kibby_2008]|nr:hypothetical protein AX17_004444 [Amanita inopinata Kibby_2008]
MNPSKDPDYLDVLSLFDFAAYIKKPHIQRLFSTHLGQPSNDAQIATSDDNSDFSIVRLTGGLVNLTVRAAVKKPSTSSELTVIMKYAPPFVAASHGNVPLVESRALSLLAETPSVKQSLTKLRVRIPEPFWLDEHEHILAMRDLGKELVTVDDWLCPLLGLPPNSQTCTSVGDRLGEALAIIHTDELLQNNVKWEAFVNPDISDIIASEVVGKIKDTLIKHLSEADASGTKEAEKTAAIISEIIQKEYQSTEAVKMKMFSSGDLWIGSILLGPGADPEIGVIDWEFAGAGRPLQDVGQLSAWLHLFAQASASASSDTTMDPAATRQKIESTSPWITAQSLFSTYAHRLRGSTQFSWIINPRSQSEERQRMRVIRSTWILHGRELISDATAPYMSFKFERILRDRLDAWKKRVVEVGCWYVQMAVVDSDSAFSSIVAQERFLRSLYH